MLPQRRMINNAFSLTKPTLNDDGSINACAWHVNDACRVLIMATKQCRNEHNHLITT